MEIALIIIGVIIAIGLLDELIKKIKSVNWSKFLGFLIIGSILLAVIFSFTAEGALVIAGAYVILILMALLFGIFSKKTVGTNYERGIEKGHYEVAKNLLGILDDETIANKTNLSIDEVKALRLEN